MSGLNIAIPKRRGTGYLKQPYGHHAIAALDEISYDEKIDMNGLDRHLNLEYRYVEVANRAEIVARVLPRLARHYGFKNWREDYNGFWAAVQGTLHNA